MIDNQDSQPWNAGIAYARHDEILTWPSRNLPYDYFNIQIKRIIIWFEARVQSEHETLPPCLPVNEVWWSDPNLLCLRQPCWSWTGCQRGTWSPSLCGTCSHFKRFCLKHVETMNAKVEADNESSDLFIDRSNIHSYTEGEDWMSPSQAAEMLVLKDGGIQVTPNYLQYCLITIYTFGSVTNCHTFQAVI